MISALLTKEAEWRPHRIPERSMRRRTRRILSRSKVWGKFSRVLAAEFEPGNMVPPGQGKVTLHRPGRRSKSNLRRLQVRQRSAWHGS